MKKFKLLALTAAVAGSFAGVSSTAVAGASANVGFVSDYYYRGIYQTSSSASAGVDYEHESGAYVGTWWADVDDGVEYDYYVGYAGEFEGVSYDVAYIVYDYSDDWDNKYTEIDLNFGYGPVSLEYAVGEYDSSPAQDYTFLGLTGEYKGFYLTLGSFGDDFNGDYTEIGYGTEVGGFDVGVSLIDNDADLDNKSAAGDGETAMVFSLGKSFDL